MWRISSREESRVVIQLLTKNREQYFKNETEIYRELTTDWYVSASLYVYEMSQIVSGSFFAIISQIYSSISDFTIDPIIAFDDQLSISFDSIFWCLNKKCIFCYIKWEWFHDHSNLRYQKKNSLGSSRHQSSKKKSFFQDVVHLEFMNHDDDSRHDLSRALQDPGVDISFISSSYISKISKFQKHHLETGSRCQRSVDR